MSLPPHNNIYQIPTASLAISLGCKTMVSLLQLARQTVRQLSIEKNACYCFDYCRTENAVYVNRQIHFLQNFCFSLAGSEYARIKGEFF
jgi:hypothetical protein